MSALENKFIVESYFCNSETLTKKMNEHYAEGYYPKEIKINPYLDKAEGFIIYELIEVENR